jgi:ubiquitin C-terminal hydrolase
MKGFINNGNSCYFNVSLKMLLVCCPELEDYSYEGDCVFTHLFFRLVRAYYDPSIPYIDPRPLLDVFRERFPSFSVYHQHDAQECVLSLIDILEKELPHLKKKFYGMKENQVIYPNGKNVHPERFSMHLLESEPRGKLVDMYKKSFKWNTIENYYDDEGNRYNLATSRSIIKKFPEKFIISFDSKSYVEVFTDDEHMELLCSVVHLGTQHSGHYVILIRDKGKWYLHDDMSVVEMKEFPKMEGHYIVTYNLKIQ